MKEAVKEVPQSLLLLTRKQQVKKAPKRNQGVGGISYSFLVSILYVIRL